MSADFELFMKENDVTEEQLAIAKAGMRPSAPVPDYLYVGASSIEGEGVFVSCALPRGAILDDLWRNGWTTTGLKMNHSPDPNCEVDRMRLFAKRDVTKDEELTVNYREVLR